MWEVQPVTVNLVRAVHFNGFRSPLGGNDGPDHDPSVLFAHAIPPTRALRPSKTTRTGLYSPDTPVNDLSSADIATMRFALDHREPDVKPPPRLSTGCSRRRKNVDRVQGGVGESVGAGPFRCGVCGKVSSTRAKAMGHYRVHTGERPYQCEVCFKTFSDGSNFKRHRRLHLGSDSGAATTHVF
ncbi:zinc finger protein-like [Tropilaelaps mercedesae]|uniref:Zinc finger protein-like n=1 Tax=Tropilaelaps mercedesae TaxID=418985 RepID=A0A1V9XG77_9ACAR|nr:zinc finger protein-like [Tropilaelaps mercedesae]